MLRGCAAAQLSARKESHLPEAPFSSCLTPSDGCNMMEWDMLKLIAAQIEVSRPSGLDGREPSSSSKRPKAHASHRIWPHERWGPRLLPHLRTLLLELSHLGFTRRSGVLLLSSISSIDFMSPMHAICLTFKQKCTPSGVDL